MTIHRTQKAQGLATLADHGHNTGSFQILDNPMAKPHWDEAHLSTEYMFARPCPTRPRHGFVESRIVKNYAELQALWRETLKHDKRAEMILMPFMKAQYSAIVTTRAVALGLGHDGATAGRAGCVTLPLSCVDIPASLLESAHVQSEPYIELVNREYETRFVQVRDGERVKAFGNFIPERVTVCEVLTVGAETDLLAWESAIANAAKGAVVHHPKGNMLSHFSVHASLHNVPVVFDDVAPIVGDVLEPTTENVAVDCRAVSRGLRYGLGMSVLTKDYRKLMALIFFATHQAAALTQTADGCVVVGIAAALFARFGAAGCLGELRHSKRKAHRRSVDRDQVYFEAFADYETARHKLKAAWKDFYFGEWGNAFGGRAWANCTANTIKLDRRIQDVVRRADNESALALIAQLNVNVNLAHNGGWWLNKFTGKRAMNDQATGDLNAVAAVVFTAYECILGAALGAPLAEYAGVSIPKLPVVVSLVRVGQSNVYMKAGARREFVSDKIPIDSPEQRAALAGLVEAIGGKPRSKHVEAQYRTVTMPLSAALQIAFPAVAQRMEALRHIAETANNPFKE